MKKSLIVILVVLLGLAGWAGATYVAGQQTEARYAALVDEFGQLGPLRITLEDYRRGFLASTAQTALELSLPAEFDPERPADAPPPEPQVIRLTFASDIHHGPLTGGGVDLARIESRLVAVAPKQEEFAALLAEVPALGEPLSVTRIGFGGTVHDELRIPAISTTLDDASLSWSGLSAETLYRPGDKTLRGSFAMPGLQLLAEDGEMVWEGLSGRYDLVEALPLVYVGSTAVDVGRLVFDLEENEGGQLVMQGLHSESRSVLDGTLVHIDQTVDFAGLTTGGQTYGPGRLVMAMKNLDGEVLGGFQQQVRDLYREAGSVDPDALVAELLPLYVELFSGLLARSPELEITTLTFATPHGDLAGRLLVRFDGSAETAGQGPLAVLKSLDARADLTLDEALARRLIAANLENELTEARRSGQIPESFSDADLENLAGQQAGAQLEMLLTRQLAVRDGEKIATRAVFREGALEVNGQPLPLFQP